MLDWQSAYVLAIVCATVVVLVKDWLTPASAMFCAMTASLAAGIISPDEAIAGFSNPAPITIAALCVLARAVEKTGMLTPILAATLGEPRSKRLTLARLLVPVSFSSAVLNNTPIVAMMVPEIERWTTKQKHSPSDYLMPLSFAAILGGSLTLMGTATHIIVSGLIESVGLAPFGFFEISKIGLPLAVCGLATIVLLAPVVLPSRRSPRQEAEQEARDFVIDMMVQEEGPLINKDVTEAGLRNLESLFLVEVERVDGHSIVPVRPATILQAKDRLRFVGRVEDVVELQRIRGLVSAEQKIVLDLGSKEVDHFEAVVGGASPLVGKTLKEAEFRRHYDAAVLAIHRSGQRIDAKLGDVKLRTGDTLLLAAGGGFQEDWRERRDFLLVSRLGTPLDQGRPHAGSVAAIILGMVVAAATNILPLVSAGLIAAAALILFRLLSPSEARKAVNLDVVVTIASALGLAKAMVNSGLAAWVAHGLVNALSPLGSSGLLLGIVLATSLLKEVITNNAAAMLILPIALTSAQGMGLDPRGFAFAVSIAASTSFLAPIGYQTNVMVYGPGGYHFGDYLRLGIPLTIVVLAILMVGIPHFWPL